MLIVDVFEFCGYRVGYRNDKSFELGDGVEMFVWKNFSRILQHPIPFSPPSRLFQPSPPTSNHSMPDATPFPFKKSASPRSFPNILRLLHTTNIRVISAISLACSLSFPAFLEGGSDEGQEGEEEGVGKVHYDGRCLW